MEHSVTAESPSATAAGFASLLSTLMASSPRTDPKPAPRSVPKNEDGWLDEGLANDVASLSYERALRAHARYRSSDFDYDPAGEAFPEPAAQKKAAPRVKKPLPTKKIALEQAAPEVSVTAVARKTRSRKQIPTVVPAFAPTVEAAPERTPAKTALKSQSRATTPSKKAMVCVSKRKNASVTIRLCDSEYEQLRDRADEAGMTISAYLRSCTLEVESLRTQVKSVLAEMKAASYAQGLMPAPKEKPVTPAAREHSWTGWFGWLKNPLPKWQMRTRSRAVYRA
jgi:predicted DNA binding CopG/RHH family protein